MSEKYIIKVENNLRCLNYSQYSIVLIPVSLLITIVKELRWEMFRQFACYKAVIFLKKTQTIFEGFDEYTVL
jgi:hypothetical protein